MIILDVYIIIIKLIEIVYCIITYNIYIIKLNINQYLLDNLKMGKDKEKEQ